MAHMSNNNSHYLRGPSPAFQQQSQRYSPSPVNAAGPLNYEKFINQLDNFIRFLSQEPSAIPEQQYRLSYLIPALTSDDEFSGKVVQHLWECCVQSSSASQQYKSRPAAAPHIGSGDSNNNATLPQLSTYDFARICSVLIPATTTSPHSSNQSSSFLTALKRLCGSNYTEYVKTFMERHDEPTTPATPPFDKDKLKLFIQLAAELVNQLDLLELLFQAMRVIVPTCYSIMHVQDRSKDSTELSEELVLTASMSVMRIAGPKIDDPTINAHLLKEYPHTTSGLFNNWEEIFVQIRNILIADDSKEPHRYSGRVKTQLLALLEARAGYWGMLSSQYSAMQACATAYVTGDQTVYGAACAEYFSTFGNGLGTDHNSPLSESALPPQEQYDQQQQQQHQQQNVISAWGDYAQPATVYHRPSNFNDNIPTTNVTYNNHNMPSDAESGSQPVLGDIPNDAYQQYLTQTNQQQLLAEFVDGVPEDDFAAEQDKFLQDQGVYVGADDVDPYQANGLIASMNHMGFANNNSRSDINSNYSGNYSNDAARSGDTYNA